MNSTLLEPKNSSSGRQLYMQLWCGTFYMHPYKQSSRQKRLLIQMHTKPTIP